MASIKLGTIVTGIKGKVGGNVFQGGRASGILKNLTRAKRKSGAIIITNTGEEVLKSLGNFSEVTKYWSQITIAERSSWDALLGVWTFTNKFGDVYNGTSYQIFTAVNVNRLILGLSLLATAPIKVDAEKITISIADYSVSGSCDLTIVGTTTNVQSIVVTASQQQNATRNVGSMTFRQITAEVIPTLNLIDLLPSYQGAYARNPQTGSVIIFQVWYTIAGYPRKQFFESFKVKVVA